MQKNDLSRRERVLKCLDIANQRGVEIGPLDRPIISRSDGDILYLDHLNSDNLKLKYALNAEAGLVNVEKLVAVDLVAAGRKFKDILGDRGPVDYVIASHVIEHIPNPIGWLCELAHGMVEDGCVSLIIPDRRFTFDHFRRPSNTGDLVDAFVQDRNTATPGQIFDYVANVAFVDPELVWAGKIIDRQPVPGHMPTEAMRLARMHHAEKSAPDIHCSVFSVHEFTEVLRQLITLDLLPFEVAALSSPVRGETDFFVTLRKSSAPASERAKTVPVPIQEVFAPEEGETEPEPVQHAIVIPFSVSLVRNLQWFGKLIPRRFKNYIKVNFLRQI